jgi:hypothetical protein
MRDELISLIETKGDLPPIPEVLINLEKRVNNPGCARLYNETGH